VPPAKGGGMEIFMSNERLKNKKLFIRSLKIAVGSLIAIWIATWIGLQFAASAGIVTLLSVVTTKWDTVKLSIARVVTFFVSVIIAYITFSFIHSEWIAYGIYIFIIVLASNLAGWGSTVSVNAVIGTHFLSTMDFSLASVMNEFLIVVLGAGIAIILNLINGNRSQLQKLRDDIQYVEETLQMVLGEMADYLRHKKMEKNVWQSIIDLEAYLEYSIERAYEYQGNTFASHPGYYIQYMEMRMQQCGILHNLHHEVKKIRELPKQAEIVADFISYMKEYIAELNEPEAQHQRLQELIEHMRKGDLPQTHAEFEGRIILYHVLMDLDDFLVFKKRFVNSLSDKQRRIYWGDTKTAA